MAMTSFIFFIWISVLCRNCFLCDDLDVQTVFSTGGQADFRFESAKPSRYLLYEVNPGEGFNLRRDVYIRMANLVRFLNDDELWTLVLPPWNRLYHWRSAVKQSQIPWSTFFDLKSLQRYIPVMEFSEFLNATESRQIDEVYYLQGYKEGWKDGKWEEKMDERDCIEQNSFVEDVDGSWLWWFWDFPNVTAKNFKCISIQAQSTYLKKFLVSTTHARSVFLVRAETLIHGSFSEWSREFWTARRSMRFAKHLRRIGDSFRSTYLNSTDTEDKTALKDDWRRMKRKHGLAVGGPYIAVHLRRRDFLYSHKEDIPSLAGAAQQIEKVLVKLDLRKVFVATDAPDDEFEELREHLLPYEVYRYVAPEDVLAKYMDGGVAIVDQWICTHARHFIGTAVSTFSFRIHEEREILGFASEATFNCFCPDNKPGCDQPSKWVAIYD